jgi:TonB family protein
MEIKGVRRAATAALSLIVLCGACTSALAFRMQVVAPTTQATIQATTQPTPQAAPQPTPEPEQVVIAVPRPATGEPAQSFVVDIPESTLADPSKPMHIGGNIKKPIVIYTVNPEYSQQARKAKFSGDVEVYLWVDKNGHPSHVRVEKGAGMGLDEKAVEAVRQYKFKPATLDGKPVTVDLYIDVNFQIF